MPKLPRTFCHERERVDDPVDLTVTEAPFLSDHSLQLVLSPPSVKPRKSKLPVRTRFKPAQAKSSQDASSNNLNPPSPIIQQPLLTTLTTLATTLEPTLLPPSPHTAAVRIGATRKPKQRHPAKVVRQRTLDDYVSTTARQQGIRRTRAAMEGVTQEDRIDSFPPACHVLFDMTDISTVSSLAIDRPTKRQKPDSTLTGDKPAIDRVVIELEEQQVPPLSSKLEYDKGIVFS